MCVCVYVTPPPHTLKLYPIYPPFPSFHSHALSFPSPSCTCTCTCSPRSSGYGMPPSGPSGLHYSYALGGHGHGSQSNMNITQHNIYAPGSVYDNMNMNMNMNASMSNMNIAPHGLGLAQGSHTHHNLNIGSGSGGATTSRNYMHMAAQYAHGKYYCAAVMSWLVDLFSFVPIVHMCVPVQVSTHLVQRKMLSCTVHGRRSAVQTRHRAPRL